MVALVQDRPGVLTRVASMFRRRGYNIASLAVGKSEQLGLSRMTVVVNGDDDTVAQVTKQLDKLIEVIHVSNISNEEIVVRELALIKVSSTATNRGEIIQIVNLFRANIVDVGTQSMVIEITGEEDKIQALYSLLEPFGILEMLRTRPAALVRGQSDGRGSDSIAFDVYGSRSSTGNGNGHGEVRVV